MFCTTCGATVSATQQFCTSCGASVRVESEGLAEISSLKATEAVSEIASVSPTRSFKKTTLLIGLALIVGVLMGTVLTAAGVAKFAIGVRFTQEELDDAKTKAEKRGYDRGDKAGYDRGYDTGSSDGYDSGYSYGQTTGYSSGKRDGCNDVFDEIGEYLIAIRYPFNKLSVYGYYWPRSSIC